MTPRSCSAASRLCKIDAMNALSHRSDPVRTETAWPNARRTTVAGHRQIAWRSVGPAGATTWLVLHGGPGSGAQPGLADPFAGTVQRLVLPDQRGCGAGRPRGGLHGNHTAALVNDLERLRCELGIQRWSILAGSWGTVLALAYADRHPQQVERLVMRGAFAVSRRECAGVLAPTEQVRRRAGAEPLWPARSAGSTSLMLCRLQQVLQSGTPGVTARRLLRHWRRTEQVLALKGMERSLREFMRQGASTEAARVRRQIARLNRGLRRDRGHARSPGVSRQDRASWQKFRIQAHYLRHRCFVRPGQLDRAVLHLARRGVHMDWVHGRFDAVCPPSNSGRWHRLACAQTPGLSRLHRPPSGHLGSEPAMLQALRERVRPCVS